LEIVIQTFDSQGKVSLIGRREHPLFLVQCLLRSSTPENQVNGREILGERKQHRPAELADA
ncbi:hypothetical protein, partial [Pseudomonas sp. 10S4]|uniref:hypothetical protein n=1 Tax=Pseudomonas sp. 10S4 TaxID=3048583 RepID=UPI002B22E030